VTIVAGPAWIAVMAIAARWRGWPVADYFALVVPRRSDFAFGFACMAALLIAFDVLTFATGRDLVPASCSNPTRRRARRHDGAFFHRRRHHRPVTEEIVFADSCFAA